MLFIRMSKKLSGSCLKPQDCGFQMAHVDFEYQPFKFLEFGDVHYEGGICIQRSTLSP